MAKVKSSDYDVVASWMMQFCRDSHGRYEFSNEYRGIIYKEESVVSVFTKFLSYLKANQYTIDPAKLAHIRIDVFGEMQIMSFKF